MSDIDPRILGSLRKVGREDDAKAGAHQGREQAAKADKAEQQRQTALRQAVAETAMRNALPRIITTAQHVGRLGISQNAEHRTDVGRIVTKRRFLESPLRIIKPTVQGWSLKSWLVDSVPYWHEESRTSYERDSTTHSVHSAQPRRRHLMVSSNDAELYLVDSQTGQYPFGHNGGTNELGLPGTGQWEIEGHLSTLGPGNNPHRVTPNSAALLAGSTPEELIHCIDALVRTARIRA